MRIRTQCRQCGLPYKARIEPGGDLECPGCGEATTIARDGWSPEERAVEICPVCDCKHLYRQRDFNVPWTYGLSLIVLSGVDLLLYFKMSNKVVCYKCDTVFRDAVPSSRQGEFNLLKHDVLKYGKSWQELKED